MIQPKIFISYKHHDADSLQAVEWVETVLKEMKLGRLIDKDIRAGTEWSAELYTALLDCSGAVALIGKEAAKSEWCRREWWMLRERATREGIPLVPISVDGTLDSADILGHLEAVRLKDAQALPARLVNLKEARLTADSYLTAHHAWLRTQFKSLNCWKHEPFTLRQVYVETDCGVLTLKDLPERDAFDERDPKNGGRTPLVKKVTSLLDDPSLRQPIIVQGPPGAGKTAFTLRLANELLDQNYVPILVRFRDMNLEEVRTAEEIITDAVRIGPLEDSPPPCPDPILTNARLSATLDRNGKTVPRTVVILDGWDEVSVTGSAGYQARLDAVLPKIQKFLLERSGTKARLIMTGRPSVEVGKTRALSGQTPILTMRPMTAEALEAYAEKISNRLHQGQGAWQLDLNRVEPLLKTYRQGRTGYAPKSDLLDVMGSPLLAFLAFRTVAESEEDPASLVSAPTKLYRELVNITVAGAGKGTDRLEKAVHLPEDDLRFLLHKVASIISILGAESVTFTELEQRLEADEAFERRFNRARLGSVVEAGTEGSLLLELLVSFFFKGGNTELGCEFLHKSFREFLYADYIFSTIADFGPKPGHPVDPPGQFGWKDFDPDTMQYTASRALAPLIAPQRITPEVRQHLIWLIKDDIASDPERWLIPRDILLDLFIWWAESAYTRPVLERGHRWHAAYLHDLALDAHPMERDAQRSQAPLSATQADAYMGEVLMELTAIVHAAMMKHSYGEDGVAGSRKAYRSNSMAPRFRVGSDPLAYIARINGEPSRLLGPFPCFAELRGADLRGADLRGADLRGANLIKADLREANLSGADLIKADLSGAHLSGAHLSGAQLSGAQLSGAHLSGAQLSGAHLSGANLSGANLSEANLSGADLRDANLIGAHLIGAVLIGAHLIGAVLREADLRGANLIKTDLSGANLSGANLSGANLREADLSGANLIRADLSGADLRDANLSGANLSGANLIRADLRGAFLPPNWKEQVAHHD